MNDKEAPLSESGRLRGINSLLGIGEVECDKCGKIIRQSDRYCCNTHECPICGVKFETMVERDSHFSQQHTPKTPRGTRYCLDCSFQAGYLKMVRNRKTGEVFPAMFTLRDEEVIED